MLDNEILGGKLTHIHMSFSHIHRPIIAFIANNSNNFRASQIDKCVLYCLDYICATGPCTGHCNIHMYNLSLVFNIYMYVVLYHCLNYLSITGVLYHSNVHMYICSTMYHVALYHCLTYSPRHVQLGPCTIV